MQISADQHEEIIRRYQAGESANSLGKELGSDSAAVLRILRSHNISIRDRGHYNRKISPDRDEEIIRRYQAGESCIRLANAFGVTQGAILFRLKKHGIARRPSLVFVLSSEQQQQACMRYLAGESGLQVARSLGISPTTLCKYLRRNGVKVRKPGPAALQQVPAPRRSPTRRPRVPLTSHPCIADQAAQTQTPAAHSTSPMCIPPVQS